jgi:hypothetical protein
VVQASRLFFLESLEVFPMNEELPVLPLVVGSAVALYLGYEINRRRNKLRKIFNTFDRQESKIAQALESLVESGQLRPYCPPEAH